MCVTHIITLIVCSWVKSCDCVKRVFGLKREEVMEEGEQCTKNFFCLTSYTLLSILNVIYYNQNTLWFITILILPQIHVMSQLNPFHKLTSCFLKTCIILRLKERYLIGCAKCSLDWFGVQIWCGKDDMKAGEYIQAGLILCQGYIPEKHADQNYATRTQNSHLTGCISWELGDWQPHTIYR
jgi:hypothetical protein